MRASNAEIGNLSSSASAPLAAIFVRCHLLSVKFKTPPASRKMLTGSSCCCLNRIAEASALEEAIRGTRVRSMQARIYSERGFPGCAQPSHRAGVVPARYEGGVHDQEDIGSSGDRCGR